MTDTAWDIPPPPEAVAADTEVIEFWGAREFLEHVHKFARARGVGPWSLLGLMLVRIVASTTPKIVLPALTGGHASLNLFAGIVAFTGGGKGVAEAASYEAIKLPHVDVVGPGSGEGIGHLFKRWDAKEKAYATYRAQVIVSAPEIGTLNALKGRQSSTLFPELNKAWFGDHLGFSYVAREKSLPIERHSYRLCLTAGIQPANAGMLLDDVDAGTPGRWLWLPTSDHGAPRERPRSPGSWTGWTLAKSVGNPDHVDPTRLRPMEVCDSAVEAVDQGVYDRLHETSVDPFEAHAVMSRLKVAAALALAENRIAVNEEDWQLAGVVHSVSMHTRLRVIDVRNLAYQQQQTSRALDEGRRDVIKAEVVREDEFSRVCVAITRKLQRAKGDWVPGKVVRQAIPVPLRHHFDKAIERLEETGQIEIESVAGTGQKGLRIRLKERSR